ncbi:GDP-fucose protein O-fucosyltransferase 1-like [Asterias amurensis]|uniref:GDP-fucose protein O-fucosyltransferase 1-like n=1 Tax=Asterias amurensis TaxID=7602 RepID=UPI003AB39CF8
METKVCVKKCNFKLAMFLHVLILNVLFACFRKSYAETSHAYTSETNSEHGMKSSEDLEGLGPSSDCSEDDDSCFIRDEEHELAEEVHGIAGAESETKAAGYTWDNNGYIMFCPCMGRFGNQAEHYLGAMAFAKALNRTLVLPPFRTYAHASFGELFQVGPALEFHRVILMEDFMKFLAPKYWPPGQRVGYAHLPVNDDSVACTMTNGSPFGPFWNHFNVTFDSCIKYQLYNVADISNKQSLETTKRIWDERFPPKEHPVIALRGSPGSYPMLGGNRAIQKYFKWESKFFQEAGTYIKETFQDEGFVGIHLRNGIDWVRACQHINDHTLKRFMASTQCLDATPDAIVTKELCLPSLSHIVEHTAAVFKHVNARHLYIATDKQPYIEEFTNLLQPVGVTVHYLKPNLVETDLMILGQADYFIGNCISSFTSFVKRERDANGKPSSFFGQDLNF